MPARSTWIAWPARVGRLDRGLHRRDRAGRGAERQGKSVLHTQRLELSGFPAGWRPGDPQPVIEAVVVARRRLVFFLACGLIRSVHERGSMVRSRLACVVGWWNQQDGDRCRADDLVADAAEQSFHALAIGRVEFVQPMRQIFFNAAAVPHMEQRNASRLSTGQWRPELGGTSVTPSLRLPASSTSPGYPLWK